MRPRPVEIATGRVLGPCDEPVALDPAPARTPVEALELSLLPALLRTPCAISFTGGRDSSAVLAVATRLARREGLTPPVPVTLEFPGIPSADERGWQELVLRHLRLPDRVRIEVEWEEGELDLLGPAARGLLERHGLLWPPNVLLAVKQAEWARGGAAVSGLEGDGLLGRWPWASAALLCSLPPRPSRAACGAAALAAAPRPLRERIALSRVPVPPWLSPRGWAELRALLAEELHSIPRTWSGWVSWWANRRYVQMLRAAFGALAAENDVLAVHPLMEEGFLAALARAGGRRGFGGRRGAMRALFGDLLPPEVIDRTTKAATFTQLCWGPHSRAFVAEWDGRGAGPLVDPERLRAVWRDPAPDERSALLLQSVWLARRSAEA
ncbi:MAG: asparagine synthase-related protein [Solirubrobacterales bacterium]